MSTVNSASVQAEVRGDNSALGNIPDVHNNTSVTQTITITGTGKQTYTVNDVWNSFKSQNALFRVDLPGTDYPLNMYVHAVRVYGSAGGFISMMPFPHRQYAVQRDQGTNYTFVNWGLERTSDAPTFGEVCGGLTQMYDFGIEGSTRPHLSWTYPKNEILNNPFSVNATGFYQPPNLIASNCFVCIVESSGPGTIQNHFVQFDVTVQPSTFISTFQALGAAVYESAQLPVNYKPPLDAKQKIKDAEEAYDLMNKKRKIKHVKELTMPDRDSH